MKIDVDKDHTDVCTHFLFKFYFVKLICLGMYGTINILAATHGVFIKLLANFRDRHWLLEGGIKVKKITLS
jgi:hypothetical protein